MIIELEDSRTVDVTGVKNKKKRFIYTAHIYLDICQISDLFCKYLTLFECTLGIVCQTFLAFEVIVCIAGCYCLEPFISFIEFLLCWGKSSGLSRCGYCNTNFEWIHID